MRKRCFIVGAILLLISFSWFVSGEFKKEKVVQEQTKGNREKALRNHAEATKDLTNARVAWFMALASFAVGYIIGPPREEDSSGLGSPATVSLGNAEDRDGRFRHPGDRGNPPSEGSKLWPSASGRSMSIRRASPRPITRVTPRQRAAVTSCSWPFHFVVAPGPRTGRPRHHSTAFS